MADLKTDTVICSVDAANMRSAVFFGLKHSSLEQGPVETPATAARKSTPCETYFATYRRQVKEDGVPCRVRKPPALLCLGDVQIFPKQPFLKAADYEVWLPPFTYCKSDFSLASVARATSAAPFFLPPVRGE
jgi:hypothetical protein